MDASCFFRPAFIVGVTGHMDPLESVLTGSESGNDARERIRLLFRFLKHGALRNQMEATLPHPQDAPGLDAWPGLSRTPIVVLTCLAPGADSLVAEVALELGMLVRAFLPFTTELYQTASTFVRNPSAPTDPEKLDQERFRYFVDRIGKSHVHPVRLADEVDLDESALIARMRADRDAPDPAGRHRRYQAAGEYVASHCDLLLALWDDDEDSGAAEGTGGIVRAKLRGMTAQLLPSANAFTWTNCGPVAHLYLPRRKRGSPPDPAKLGKMRWLHAGAFPAAQRANTATAAVQSPFPGNLSWTWQATEKRESDYRRWQLAGNHGLCRLARNLNRFNEDYKVPRPLMQPLCRTLDPGKRMDAGRPAPGTLAEILRQRAPKTYHALAPAAAARRHAADMSGHTLRPWSRRVLLLMFLLVFVFAASLHLFSHWHPQGAATHNIRPHGDAPADHGDPTPHGNSSPPAVSGEADHFSPVRFTFGLACLLSGAASLGLFWWHRRGEVEERDHDYRALSEGLRVQFAWCLAGLPRSAAAHYMQRQSNELAWIHRALSSLSMPHHRWADWFNRLDVDLRLRLLRWTQANWVNEQARYHERRAREHTHHMHFLHKLGGVLAMAGVWQVVALVIDARWRFLATTTDSERFASLTVRTGGAVGLALLCWFTLLWTRGLRANLKKRNSWSTAVSKAFLPACRNLLDTLVPSGHAPDFQTTRQRHRRMLGSFGAHVPLAAGLGIFGVAGSAACAGHHPSAFPPVTDLITIVSGICLLAGALLVAWTEKNLLSEQAYQFNTMASLFAAAGSRLDDLLREAEGAAPEAPTRTVAIREAQRLLYDLGVEALDESAEWLILHRARPMEPVMAG